MHMRKRSIERGTIMERYAKGFRNFGGFLILLNVINFFLPAAQCTQEGYAPLHWSQFHYIKALFRQSLPYAGGKAIPVTGVQTAFIFCCMALPLILALAAGIWGIAGSPRQRGSSILALAVLVLYIGLAAGMDILWPEAQLTQVYTKGIACLAGIGVSGGSAVMAVLSLVSTPRKAGKVQKPISQVQEMKQRQTEADYNIIEEKSRQEPRDIPETPRGVMVGLAGAYKGAKIPMADGEFIKLGRKNTNHLVFEGQPRVSREHCKIKWDARDGKYIIYDYSSTGSFINGSHECLPQNLNMPLEPGTVVALGDDTNVFRLE